MTLHRVREMFVCECGFRTRDLDVLLYHLENPDENIGREKLKEIINGRS